MLLERSWWNLFLDEFIWSCLLLRSTLKIRKLFFLDWFLRKCNLSYYYSSYKWNLYQCASMHVYLRLHNHIFHLELDKFLVLCFANFQEAIPLYFLWWVASIKYLKDLNCHHESTLEIWFHMSISSTILYRVPCTFLYLPFRKLRL